MQNPAINAGLLTIPSSSNLILINLNFYINFIVDFKKSFYLYFYILYAFQIIIEKDNSLLNFNLSIFINI